MVMMNGDNVYILLNSTYTIMHSNKTKTLDILNKTWDFHADAGLIVSMLIIMHRSLR